MILCVCVHVSESSTLEIGRRRIICGVSRDVTS